VWQITLTHRLDVSDKDFTTLGGLRVMACDFEGSTIGRDLMVETQQRSRELVVKGPGQTLIRVFVHNQAGGASLCPEL